jgi:glycosyltransferase involved in cell wall biosynthesis
LLAKKALGCGKITPGKSDLLSICIPTYNHAGPLTKCLEALIPQAREYNIPIYISDNASTDNTLKILKSFKKIYPFLYFRINNRNLGVDHNMVNVARMASTRYVWTFGSRRIPLPGILNKIYEILKESDWDLLVLNDLNSTFMVPESKKYSSAEKVFKELNRNLTGLGFQILPSEAWQSETVQKYEGTEWTVFGLTLEYIANKRNLNVFFLSNPCATSSGDSHWKSKSFQIWANWKKVVYSLPKAYSDDDKERVIQKSVDYFFGGHRFNLMYLRSKQIYNSNIFNACREDLTYYGNLSPTAAYVISKFPVAPLKLYYAFYHVSRTLARKFIHQKAPLNPTTRRTRRISYI